MTTPVFLDRFSSGLDELTRRQQASIATVLRVPARTKRYSVFEATDNQTIAKTMDAIIDRELIATDNSCGYPWTKCELTDAGREWLSTHQPIEAKQRRNRT